MTAKPDWDDAKRWVVVKDVNVFAEHARTVTDKSGKRRTIKFGKKELAETARNSNNRDRVGQPCPLTLGHTDDDKPEKDQPDIVGYARNFRTIFDDTLEKFVNVSDFYVERDRFDEAREYKRQSVEVWSNGKFFDPIALLKRTPQLDLGQWTYHRGGDIKLRYSMDQLDDDTDDRDTPPPPDDNADAPPDEGDETASPDKGPDGVHPRDHDAFVKCAKHYGMKLAAKKYGIGDGGGDVDPVAAPPGRGRVPSGTSSLPDDEKSRMRRDSTELRLGRLERMVAEGNKYAKHAISSLQSGNRNLVHERDAERCERMLVQLEAEGYRFERDAEVDRMVDMDDAAREKHVKYIRRNYAKAPVGGTDLPIRNGKPTVTRGRVTGGGESVRVKGGTEGAHADDAGEFTSDHEEKAQQYMRAHPGCDWTDAEDFAYGRRSLSGGRNGRAE